MSTIMKHKNSFFVAALILFYTVISYRVIYSGYFIWDDKVFLFDKVITDESWLRLFISPHYGMYHPVVSLWVKLDYILFSSNPIFIHVQNMIIHIVNGCLVYKILRKLELPAIWGFAFFLFHPLSTETVYWITSIKDLVCCLFSFISIYYYVEYSRNNYTRKFLYISLLACSFAIFSKTQAIILPLVLCVFDYYYHRKFSYKLLVEKLPVVLLAIISVVLNIYIRNQIDDRTALPSYNILARILIAANSFSQYCISVVFPVKQSIFYPYPFKPADSIPLCQYLYILVPLAFVLTLLLLIRHKYSDYAVSILLFIVSLAPVVQLVPIGESLRNDRYTYFTIFTIALAIELIIRDGKRALKLLKGKVPLVYLLMFVYIGFIIIMFNQRKVLWPDQKKMFESAQLQYPESEIISNTLGVIYLKENKTDRALKCFDHSIHTDPMFAQAYYNKALAFEKMELNDLAIPNYKKAISIQPNYKEALFRLAETYFIGGKFDSAEFISKQMINQRIASANVYDLLGKVYYKKGDIDNSIFFGEKAISSGKENAVYLYNLALSYGYRGLYSKALVTVSSAIALNPGMHEAFYLRGIIKFNSNKDGCEDLLIAKNKGNLMAESAIKYFCN